MSEPPQPPNDRRDHDSRKRKNDASSDASASAVSGHASVAKHPKIDGSNAALAVQPPAMLRCLTLCRDVQLTLMNMLELKDIAHLNGSCRSWRAWLKHPPLLSGVNVSLASLGLQLGQVLQTGWAPQLLISVEQELLTYEHEVEEHQRFSNGSEEKQRWHCLLLLRSLPRCTRLRELTMSIREVPQADLNACFVGLAKSLRRLRIKTLGPDSQLLQNLFHSLHPLRLLERLEIAGQAISHHLNFSALPQMPCLNAFTLTGSRFQEDTWRCTRAQIQCLTQCRSLTELNCGCWSPDERGVDDDGWQLPSAEQQIAEGIGALVSGWLNSPADVPASSTPPLRLPIIRRLHMPFTIMTPAVWSHVSRLTSLEELVGAWWSRDLTQAQWAKLALFSQLRTAAISPRSAEKVNWLKSVHIIPPLLSCTRLASLTLVMMTVRRSQLLSLCTDLPELRTLAMNLARIEDCSPLALAPNMRRLQIHQCRGAKGAPVQFRSLLPVMPQLTQLEVIEAYQQRLTAEQAAPLNAALLARMPMLTLAEFTQNLIGDDVENADFVDDNGEDDDE